SAVASAMIEANRAITTRLRLARRRCESTGPRGPGLGRRTLPADLRKTLPRELVPTALQGEDRPVCLNLLNSAAGANRRVTKAALEDTITVPFNSKQPPG